MLRSSGYCGNQSDDLVSEMVCSQLLAQVHLDDRTKMRARHAGTSDAQVAMAKLLPRTALFATANSSLLTSMKVRHLAKSIQVPPRSFETWRKEVHAMRRKIDVVAPSAQDLAAFAKFAVQARSTMPLMPDTFKREQRFGQFALSVKRRLRQEYLHTQRVAMRSEWPMQPASRKARLPKSSMVQHSGPKRRRSLPLSSC